MTDVLRLLPLAVHPPGTFACLSPAKVFVERIEIVTITMVMIQTMCTVYQHLHAFAAGTTFPACTVNLPMMKVWKKNKSDLLKLLRDHLDAESRKIHELGLRIDCKLR